ncbi:MAG: hypothetical protein GXP31_11195 [Kiritimatiellaeota bacterium]|nr:hypothetical protein [Kiritimatiellota bacterium]
MNTRRQKQSWDWKITGAALVGAVLLTAGCGKATSNSSAPDSQNAAQVGQPPTAGTMQLCNFKDGPADAPVKVEAYYPGRHEDTLAAVKALVKKFPGKVRIEIIDWRSEEGMQRRDAAGLSCAGITINGKNAFDLEVNGKKTKVLFVRGIDGEWTAADLDAAVRQVLAAGGSDMKGSGSKAKAE